MLDDLQLFLDTKLNRPQRKRKKKQRPRRKQKRNKKRKQIRKQQQQQQQERHKTHHQAPMMRSQSRFVQRRDMYVRKKQRPGVDSSSLW